MERLTGVLPQEEATDCWRAIQIAAEARSQHEVADAADQVKLAEDPRPRLKPRRIARGRAELDSGRFPQLPSYPPKDFSGWASDVAGQLKMLASGSNPRVQATEGRKYVSLGIPTARCQATWSPIEERFQMEQRLQPQWRYKLSGSSDPEEFFYRCKEHNRLDNDYYRDRGAKEKGSLNDQNASSHLQQVKSALKTDSERRESSEKPISVRN